MPGVADAIRKTQLSQDQIRRRNDTIELLRIVKEGRLHEADARQLEILKLLKELSEPAPPGTPGTEPTVPSPLAVDEDRLAALIAEKLAATLGRVSHVAADPHTAILPNERPTIRHVPLDLEHTPDTDLKTSVKDLGETKQGQDLEDPTEKLKRLKILKGLNK